MAGEIGPGVDEPPYGYPAPLPPYGYAAPQPPGGTNGMAIAALVLGICGFFFVTPIVGLVLGLVSLSEVRKSGQRGKGLAVSGIVLSSLWLALFATLITVAVFSEPDPARRDAGGNVVVKGAVPVFGLHPKDCFTVPAEMIGATDSKTRTFTVVPCSTPHGSEAVGSFTAAESTFPGVEALRAESVSQCLKVLSAYLPDSGSVPAGSMVQYVYPNQKAWSAAKHRVTCFLQFPAATMTQSVYRDMSSYTADQQRFLNAVRPLADTVSQLSVTPQTAPLADMQQRARDVAAALQSEITALTAAPWPAEVQPSVNALVTGHREAARLWTEAAEAADTTSFGDAVRQANGASGTAAMRAVRTALGLTTIGTASTV